MKRIQSEIHKNIKYDAKTLIRYYRKGKLEFTLGTTDDNIALENMQLEIAKISGTGALAKKFRVKTLFAKFYEYREREHEGKIKGRKKIRAGTLKEVKYIFENHLLKFFGDMKLCDVNERSWARYCDRAKVSDLMNHRKVFGKFLKWCKKSGYLLALPDIEEIPVHKRRKRRVLTPEEIVTIISKAEGRLLLLVSMGLFMGMRLNEIVSLSCRR